MTLHERFELAEPLVFSEVVALKKSCAEALAIYFAGLVRYREKRNILGGESLDALMRHCAWALDEHGFIVRIRDFDLASFTPPKYACWIDNYAEWFTEPDTNAYFTRLAEGDFKNLLFPLQRYEYELT